MVSVFAKRARGLMIRFAAISKVDSVEALKRFDLENYRYVEAKSDADTLVFAREAKPTPVTATKSAKKPAAKRRKVTK